MITSYLNEHQSGPAGTYLGSDPVEEIVHDPFTLDMEIVSAIRLIQKNERGRQGRLRYNQIQSQFKANKLSLEHKKKIKEGKINDTTPQEKEAAAAENIQRRIRGILARKQVE